MRPRQPLYRLLSALLLAAVALGSAMSAAHHHHDSVIESPACEVCLLGHFKHGATPASSALIGPALPASVGDSNLTDDFVPGVPRLFAVRAPPVRCE